MSTLCVFCDRLTEACPPDCLRHRPVAVELTPAQVAAVIIACDHWLQQYAELPGIAVERKLATGGAWARAIAALADRNEHARAAWKLRQLAQFPEVAQ